MRQELSIKYFKLTVIKAIVILLLTSALLSLILSCRTTRSFEATVERSTESEQRYRDSIRTSDSIRLVKHYEEKLNEMTSDISFFQSNEQELVKALNELTDTLAAKGVFTDEMKARLERLRKECESKPTAKINPDGSIDLSGPLKALNLKYLQLQKKSEQDSIALHELQAAKEVQVKKVVEDKTEVAQKKKTGWPWYVWLLIGAALAHVYRLIPVAKRILT